MFRIQQPDRGSVEEEKRAARNLVLKNIGFFIVAVTLIKMGKLLHFKFLEVLFSIVIVHLTCNIVYYYS